jgi:CO/xanthine dehydrogenase Mo-binding subunit
VYSRGDDAWTLYVTSQNPHVERLLMTAFVLGLPEHKVRVVAPDVGGGFGSKIYLYAEETALVWAAKRVGRPIKWTAERSEAFLSDAHGRDHVTRAELALDKDGKFLGLRVHTTANMGAYLSTFASCIPTILYATLLAGQYATPAIYCEVKAVFTNTAPVDAYRGAGRPEATYVVERIVETAARELKIDPAELRRRNFIKSFPYADTGGPDLRHRRLRRHAQARAADRRRGGLRRAQGREREEGLPARDRLQLLHRGLRVGAIEHRRRARRARGPVRGGRGARAPHRQGHRVHRLALARAGARDHVRAGGGRQARHRAR